MNKYSSSLREREIEREEMLRILAKRASSGSASGSWRSVSAVQIVETRRDYSLGVLPDGVDRNSEAFSRNSKAMGVLISDLQSHIQKVSLSGSVSHAINVFDCVLIDVCVCV